ncbi:glycosyltransferase [Bacillus tequilensis]|uniref:glycosyltransferase n=1 Tax=Bacillus tequilensis TaxID=227866 RepID=UPI00046730DC|nr:glycosyltransferase [Bacillus tequilensis]MDR4433076.1 glycosyltransferase [Bacillus tequilensis]SPU01491.1 glycosyl transferase [Bacillus tequilensis]
MTPLASVIVPMYNVEPFIEECIDSLQRQTLSDIEIILVNDGSPDRSGELAENYAKRDARIRVIHQTNGGLSAARNAGIRAAKGTYIGFVDGDDYVSSDMFQRLIEEAEQNQLDIAGCGFYKQSADGQTYVPPQLDTNRVLTKPEIAERLKHAHETRFIWYVWRYVYRRELLDRTNLMFDEDIRFAEDSPFNLSAFCGAKRVKMLDEGLYIYRENPNSLTEVPYKPAMDEQIQKQYQAKMAFYNHHGLAGACKEDLNVYICRHQLPMLLANACASPNPPKDIKKQIRRILSYHMVRQAVRHTPVQHKQLLRGERLVLALCKWRLIFLIKLFFEQRGTMKGSAKQA